jgi:ribosomal protein S12 methylthiotransferase accessory factor
LRVRREVTVSGAEDSTAKLFLHASELLLGRQPDPAADHDAEHMLQALGYAVPKPGEAGEATAAETANQVHLLKAASRFKRVFELTAPDAPGLISFGAQFDPALADPMHAGGPMVSVSGVGLSLQEAFQGCIGEGIEYLSQLQSGGDALLEVGFDEATAGLDAPALEFIAALEARRTRADTALSWHRATRHADGREVLLPSDVCVRRPPAQREFPPPFPLSTGSAAGPSRDAAALHGLLELIERDAVSLWWRGGQFGRSIPPQHEASVIAENVLQQLRQSVTGRRRTWLLDITTDIGVPCVAAVSCRPDGSGFAFGLAARPRLTAAVHSAILEMCQLELADAIIAAKRRERGDEALNAQDRTHLRRAMINADQCALLQPVTEAATHRAIKTTEASVIFELIVQRLRKLGIETLCIDLMRQRFAIPVVRVIAPGLQLEPSEIVTARLRDTIARTGGGATYTGGVALM